MGINLMKRFLFSIVLLHILSLFDSFLVAQDIDRFQNEVDAIMARDFSDDPDKPLVIFAGSSSFRMWKDVQLAFPDVQALNHGFGGSTMQELLHYADELIIRFHPDKVFIYEGDNDIALNQPLDDIMDATAKLVDLIRSQLPKTKIYLLAAKPSVARWNLEEQYVELNQAYNDFAKKNRKVWYMDIWNPMLGTDGKPMPDIFVEDNLHMNAKGYEIWKKALKKYVN